MLAGGRISWKLGLWRATRFSCALFAWNYNQIKEYVNMKNMEKALREAMESTKKIFGRRIDSLEGEIPDSITDEIASTISSCFDAALEGV